MVHLLLGKLPIRNDLLVPDFFLLRDCDHFIGEIFESYAAISVFVEPVEEVDYIPVKRIDPMEPQNLFELVKRNEIVIFGLVVSIDYLESLKKVKVWGILEIELKKLYVLLYLQSFVEQRPQSSQSLVRERLIRPLMVKWKASLELFAESWVPWLVHIDYIGVSKFSISIVIVPFQEKHSVIMRQLYA